MVKNSKLRAHLFALEKNPKKAGWEHRPGRKQSRDLHCWKREFAAFSLRLLKLTVVREKPHQFEITEQSHKSGKELGNSFEFLEKQE